MGAAASRLMPRSSHRVGPQPTAQRALDNDFFDKSAVPPSTFSNVWHSAAFRSRWMELGAILLMTLVVMALFVTLYANDGQPVPQWHLGVTINALVSLYGVIFKACLLFVVAESLMQLRWMWFCTPRQADYVELFDNASRGPFGSLLLIHVLIRRARSNRWLESFFAALGASTILAAIAIDPFLQQMVSYEPCTRVDPQGVATASRVSQMYPIQNFWSSSDLAGQVNSAAFGIEGRGSFAANTTCPTGSTCSFDSDPYWTLGMCSTCDDLTSNLTVSCPNGDPSGSFSCSTTLFASTDYAVTLDEGAFLHVVNDNRSLASLDPQDPSKPGGLSIIALSDYRKLSQYGLFSPPWNADNPNDAHFGAARCVLSACSKKLAGNYSTPFLNTTNETVLDRQPLRYFKTGTPQGDVMWDMPSDCLSPADSQGMAAAKAHYGLDEYDMCNTEGGAPTDPRLAAVCNRCLFTMSADNVRSLQDTWDSGEVANWTLTERVTSNGVFYDGGNSLPSIMFFNDGNWISTEYMSGVFGILEGIYTNYMRYRVWETKEPFSPSMPNRQRVQGQPAYGSALSDFTCAKVHGGWAALLIILFIHGVAVFVWVSIKARKTPGYTWKSSGLALLFHGLHPDTRRRFFDVDSDENMQEAANELTVQLQQCDEGWLLRPVEKEEVDLSSHRDTLRPPDGLPFAGGRPRSEDVRPRRRTQETSRSMISRPWSPWSSRRASAQTRFTNDVMTAMDDIRPSSTFSRRAPSTATERAWPLAPR